MKIKLAIVLIFSSLILQAQQNIDLKPVMKNDKYGFLNSKGDTVIGLIYDNAENFSENLALVRQKTEGRNHFYYIDVNGKIIVNFDSIKSRPQIIVNDDPTLEYLVVFGANSFKNGIALLSCAGHTMPDTWHHYRYIKKDGTPLKSYEFSFAVNFENGYGRGFQDGQYYRVNTLGEMTPIKVDTCDCFDGFVEFSAKKYSTNQSQSFPEFDNGQSDFNKFVLANQFFAKKNTSLPITIWLEIDRQGRVVDWSLMDIFNHKYSKQHYLSPDIDRFVKNMPPFKPAKIQGVSFCSKISIEFKVSENELTARFR